MTLVKKSNWTNLIMRTTTHVGLLSALGCSFWTNSIPEHSPLKPEPPRLFIGSPDTLAIERAQDGDFVRCSADAFADFVCMRHDELVKLVNFCSTQYWQPPFGWQEASVR